MGSSAASRLEATYPWAYPTAVLPRVPAATLVHYELGKRGGGSWRASTTISIASSGVVSVAALRELLARTGTEALGQRLRDNSFTLSFELPRDQLRLGGATSEDLGVGEGGGGMDGREVLIATMATPLSTLISSPTFWVSAKYEPRYGGVTRT